MRGEFEPPAVLGDRAVWEAPLRARKHCLYALICALWILPGLLGRSPWHPDELLLAPAAAQMAREGLALAPLLLGEPFLSQPPLYLWLAALSAKVFAFALPLHEGARLINIPLLAFGFLFLYLAGAGRYGAKTGWLAVLLALGAAGFMVRAHLLETGVAAFFGASAMLWGALLLRTRALAGGAVCGGALGFLFLAAGTAAGFAAAFFLPLLFLHSEWRRGAAAGMLVAAACALPLLFLWPAVLAQREPEVFALWLRTVIPPFAPGNIAQLPALFAWALFPALPIAAAGFAMRRLRARAEGALFAAALFFALAALTLLFGEGAAEEKTYLALPALSLVAARALQKLPDDAAVVLDWFALLIVGVFCAGAAWLLWLCLLLGAPEFVAGYVADVFPGNELPPPSVFAVVAGAAVTVLWCSLIANFGRSNERAVVNWSCGVTVAWLLFNALWLGYADSGKSYQGMAEEIRQRLRGGCIALETSVAPRPVLAQLEYWGATVGGSECGFFLRKDGDDDYAAAEQSPLWTGGRAGKTQYLLYRVK